MLLELAQWLARDIRAFNVFNYITLRAVLATMTALTISFVLGPALIRWLAGNGSPPRRRTGKDPAATLVTTYREVVSRAASPRERSTLAEHAEFLLDLWPAGDKSTHRILEQIREVLQ